MKIFEVLDTFLFLNCLLNWLISVYFLRRLNELKCSVVGADCGLV